MRDHVFDEDDWTGQADGSQVGEAPRRPRKANFSLF
jgi:hypothetical protein